MSEWINIKEKKPEKEDSPILAFDSFDYFSMEALQYLDDGWDGPGWYKDCGEYGMGLNENEAHFSEYRRMLYWRPLPNPPEKNKE